MNIKSVGESFGKMLSLGTVLYRDVPFIHSFPIPLRAVSPEKKPFVKGERGNTMLRINLSGSFGWSPVAFVPESFNRGIVLFVNEEIPENWTHLIVSGNSFRKVGEDFIGAVFAKCPKPYDMDAYLEYRTQIGNIYSQMATSNSPLLPWHEKMKIIKEICPPENRPEEKHLFCGTLGNNGSWCYDHLTWRAKSKTPAVVHAG